MHTLIEQPSTREFLAALEARMPADILHLNTTMQFGDETKYVTAHLDTLDYPQQIEVSMLTDVQFGHVLCQEGRYLEYRDWVLSSPHRFVVFGGDMVDAAHALSVASPYENLYEPQTQVLRFVEATMPMRHRIIGYVGGNHERRSVRMFGDLGRLIASLLRIPYSSGKQMVDLYYGDHQPFSIALWHGCGGARTKGAKAQMLHRFMAQSAATLCLVGHLHDAIVLFDWYEKREKGHLVLKKKAGAMSSSFLEWWGSYAEVMGLAPSDTMMARVIVEPDGHWELTLR